MIKARNENAYGLIAVETKPPGGGGRGGYLNPNGRISECARKISLDIPHKSIRFPVVLNIYKGVGGCAHKIKPRISTATAVR